jgi:transposase
VIEPPDLSKLSSAEKDALILALIERVNVLIGEVERLRKRVGELEAELGKPPKTPDNSSLPPSRGQKSSGETSNRPKAKPHKGSHRELHPDPTRTRDVLANVCGHCAADVSACTQIALERYDRIEIPEIAPDVTRVVLYGGICPCCQKRFKAKAPEGLEPGSPFGENLRALLIYLRTAHAISFERLAQLAKDLFGLSISEGALANILAASTPAFTQASSAIRKELLSSTVLASDETSVRVGKKMWWAWTFHHATSAFFVIAPSRGKDVVEDFLGQHRPDYWLSDRLAVQMGWAKKEQQVCLAHLIREARYAIEDGDCAFAPKFKDLLEFACAIGQRREHLADATLKSHYYKLEDRLDRLLAIEPIGREGEKLKRTALRYRQHLFVFVTNRELEPTNNGSEQALRPCVTFRKVTNCFRSEWGAKLYADIRSVLETARRRAIGALHAIRLTLAGKPLQMAG